MRRSFGRRGLRRLFHWLAAASVMLPSAALSSACHMHMNVSPAKSVSVCEIAGNIDAHHAQTVSIEAVVLNTAHSIALIDPRCPDATVILRWPTQQPAESGIPALADLLNGPGAAATVGKRVFCVCTGRLSKTDALPTLEVERVDRTWVAD